MNKADQIVAAIAEHGPILSTVTVHLHENGRVSVGSQNIEIPIAIDLLEFAARELRNDGFDLA